MGSTDVGLHLVAFVVTVAGDPVLGLVDNLVGLESLDHHYMRDLLFREESPSAEGCVGDTLPGVVKFF